MRSEVNVSTGEVVECEDATPTPPSPESKAKRIATLSAECVADVQSLQFSYLVADVNNAATKAAIQDSIRQEIADRKAQFKLDKAAILAEN